MYWTPLIYGMEDQNKWLDLVGFFAGCICYIASYFGPGLLINFSSILLVLEVLHLLHGLYFGLQNCSNQYWLYVSCLGLRYRLVWCLFLLLSSLHYHCGAFSLLMKMFLDFGYKNLMIDVFVASGFVVCWLEHLGCRHGAHGALLFDFLVLHSPVYEDLLMCILAFVNGCSHCVWH